MFARILAFTFLFISATCATGLPMRPAPLFAGVAGPLIIADSSGNLEVSENTLAAISHGAIVGADWIKIDVALTTDENVVVINDSAIERTYNDQHEPAFAEVLALNDARLLIELKPFFKTEVLIEKVVRELHRARALDRVMMSSTDIPLLDRITMREPSLLLAGIAANKTEIENLILLPISVILVPLELIETAHTIVPPQLGIWGYTADTVETATKAIEQGAHGVITNIPEAVVKTLRSPPPIVIPLSK
ncbi:MAG: hypothetical protein JW841_00160 [Deltaproteobacteria bacterium]|nr:hypothetical protein [Deltaproteobacteria bacterium]